MSRHDTNQFAVYKGEEFLGVGTARELAEQLGVMPETIEFYATSSNTKRDHGNRRIAVRLND